jgi:endonuclease YncB( thermonuclease family)
MPSLIAAGALLACLVVGVSDGDTLTARCSAADDAPAPILMKLRLAEIDAPEKAQPYGARSRAHLATLCVVGRMARVRALTRDRYGRTVAWVWCDGVEANTEQVRAGLAWAYERYLSAERLRDVQSDARESQRGLWADSQPVAPWDWRRMRRRGIRFNS